jgi:hypothetical protein
MGNQKNNSYLAACIQCKEGFPTTRSHQKYCSPECAEKYRLKHRDDHLPFPRKEYNVPRGTRGAIGELSVAVDLMNHGFNVYRSQSPQAPHDLIVEKNKVLKTIEVRTGWTNRDGTMNYPKNNIYSEIVAVVNSSNIKYIPENFSKLYLAKISKRKKL